MPAVVQAAMRRDGRHHTCCVIIRTMKEKKRHQHTMPPNAITPRSLQVQPPLIAATKIEISLHYLKVNGILIPAHLQFVSNLDRRPRHRRHTFNRRTKRKDGGGRRPHLLPPPTEGEAGTMLPPLNADAAEDAGARSVQASWGTGGGGTKMNLLTSFSYFQIQPKNYL